MQAFAPKLARASPNTALRQLRTPAIYPSQARTFSHNTAKMSMSAPEAGELKIEATSLNTAPGVSLTESQKTLVGSVLDLFAGRPSLAKLGLWTDDAVFSDPLAIAKGRKQYEAQWYGLQTAFSELERQSHEVRSAGNPIELDLKMRYVVKGINKEQVVSSRVNVYTDEAGQRIVKLEDKWDGKLPESGIANVSAYPAGVLSPFFWWKLAEGWAFWCWSFTWETALWRAFRRLNASTMPHIVGVPKTAEEDAKRGN